MFYLFLLIIIIYCCLLYNYTYSQWNKRTTEHFIFALKIQLITGKPDSTLVVPFTESGEPAGNLQKVTTFERKDKLSPNIQPFYIRKANIKYIYLICYYKG